MFKDFISPRGTVVSIWGKAFIRMANGQWRPLKLGDVVQSDDALLTNQDSIVMMTDGDGLIQHVGMVAVAETGRVVATLDDLNALPAPAAGLAGGGSGGFLPGLRVERVVEGVTAATLATSLGSATLDLGRTTRSNPSESDNPASVSASSSNIAAIEEGGGIALGLRAPTGGGSLRVTVTQVPSLGQIVTAAGAPVLAGATLTPAELAGLRYLPPADYDGTTPIAPFTYSVSNGTSSATGSTQITLTAINDAPVAAAGSSRYGCTKHTWRRGSARRPMLISCLG